MSTAYAIEPAYFTKQFWRTYRKEYVPRWGTAVTSKTSFILRGTNRDANFPP